MENTTDGEPVGAAVPDNQVISAAVENDTAWYFSLTTTDFNLAFYFSFHLLSRKEVNGV